MNKLKEYYDFLKHFPKIKGEGKPTISIETLNNNIEINIFGKWKI